MTFVLAAATVAVACGDGTGVDGRILPGTYLLESVGGQPLPYVFIASTTGDTSTLVSETISFHPDRRLASRSASWRIVEGGGPATTSTERFDVAYHLAGRSVELWPICPANANCRGGDTGTITLSALVLLPQAEIGVPERVYRRLSTRAQ